MISEDNSETITGNQSFPEKRKLDLTTDDEKIGSTGKGTKAAVTNDSVLRQKIRNAIEERLSKTPDVKEIDVSSFAKAIERLLYAKASQDNNPLVLENLDERIHTLMKAIRKRRVRKQGGHRNRMETLVHILGQDLSRNICKVVTEVKLLRLQRAATACGACMRNGTCSMAPREGIADLPPLMPEPVQRLFFNTRLIEATEKTPVSQLKNQDWDTMLQEARNNIDEYHVWTKAQRKSNSPPAA